MTQAKMVLSKEEIVSKFNEQVNMTVEELEAWLDNPESKKAGTGVGLESGRKIVEILKKNPEKIPEEYDEDDLEHMRKVVGYNGRHLAQESHLKDTKTTEELEHTKSTISLKNWGHDPLKGLEKEEEQTEVERPKERKADHEASQEQVSETPGVGEPPENPQQKKGSSGGLGTKRKLEEDEGLVNDETNDVIGDRKSHEDENVEEEEEGGHARKKSKTNGEAVSSIPDE